MLPRLTPDSLPPEGDPCLGVIPLYRIFPSPDGAAEYGLDAAGRFWAFWRLIADLHDRGARPNIIAIENVVSLWCWA